MHNKEKMKENKSTISLYQLILSSCAVLGFALLTNDLTNVDGLSMLLMATLILEWLFYNKASVKERFAFLFLISLCVMLCIGIILCFGMFDFLYENANYYSNNFSIVYSFGIVIFSGIQLIQLFLKKI